MDQNQSEIAYSFLRQKLQNRELPPGTRIRYGPLGTEIGMSATPVREAIGRLASEGLVDLVPQSGAVVKRPTRDDILEVFEMREALEPFATGKAAELIGSPQLRVLAQSLESMQLIHQQASRHATTSAGACRSFDEADLQFHRTILEAFGNQRMQKAVGDYQLLTEIIGVDRHAYEPEVLELTIADHQAVYRALEARDSAEARRAMLAHLRNSRQLTLREMKPSG